MAHLTKKIKQELRTGVFNNDDYLMNAEDAAELLACSIPYVYKLAQRGKITAVRWPRLNSEGETKGYFLRYQKSDLLKFIEQNKLNAI